MLPGLSVARLFFELINPMKSTAKVEESSRPITAFATTFGLYQFLRMPFGLRNAGASYCRFVQRLVDVLGVPGIVAYLDDVLVHSEDLDTHVNLLKLVFDAHKEAGIRLNASKTHLFQEEVEYLGHLVNAEGIKLIPSYVQKIVDWPLPQTGKELSAFLGFTNYYRDFLPGFANVMAELNSVKNNMNLGMGKSQIHFTETFNVFRLIKGFTTIYEKVLLCQN